jgi:hypothetical protein
MAKAKLAEKSSGHGNPGQSVSDQDRQRMIAEAAYFRALERGFGNGGNPLDDWLVAEREINQVLPSPLQQKHELLAYEKFRQTVRKMFTETRGTVNKELVRQAFDKAAEEVMKTGEHTAETVNKIAAALSKDMANAAQKMGPKWEAFSEKTADLFDVWHDRGNLFLAQAANAVGGWLQEMGVKREQQTYHSGEMAYTGTFECAGCGERLLLRTPAHLPPCSKCRKMGFRRI